MSEEIEETTEKLYYDALSVARRTSQKIHFVNEHDKNALISHLITTNKYTNVIFVTKTKRQADELCTYLQKNELKALSIHSNKSSKEITTSVESFNSNETTVLIMTDMSLQAQSFPVINQMISYSLPTEPSHYYERLAALEEKGEGINLVSEEEHPLMDVIQWAMKVEILEVEPEGFTPTDAPEVIEKPKKVKKPRHKKGKAKKEREKTDLKKIVEKVPTNHQAKEEISSTIGKEEE